MNAAQWWGKSLAGILCGFTLAVALAGLLAWTGSGGIAAPGKSQLVMWSITPLWLAVASLVYLFPSALHAWAWLGGANIVTWVGLVIVRAFLE